jgi:hypothetical protein
MVERDVSSGSTGVDEDAVVEVEEASEPLTEDELREAQAEDAASGEAVVEVEEASEPLTADEVREAQAEDRGQ